MTSTAARSDFVNMVAEEVSCGIDRALGYWLGRIEIEVIDQSLSASQRIDAIQAILHEFKLLRESEEIDCASA